jgi:hypothetical protein
LSLHFILERIKLARNIGKYQVGILIVAPALRATATAELSYSLIALLAQHIRQIGEGLNLLPDQLPAR